MKKIFSLIIALLILSLVPLGTFAAVGDVIGYACHTDITARINGYDIASYNVNGNTYIIAENLSEYGFNVKWNPQTREIFAERNNSVTKINSVYTKPAISPSLVGKTAHQILSTDIKAYTSGIYTESFNINGATIIPFDSLSVFGEVNWDATARKIELTLPGIEVSKQPPTGVNREDMLIVGEKTLYVGMPVSALGQADEILPSNFGFNWYVYGTDTYKDFFVAGVADNKAKVLISAGKAFEYNGYKSGDTLTETNSFTSNLFTDENDNGIVHAVMLGDSLYSGTITEETCAGESKMIFHLNNAFRVYHGETPFKWCTKAETSALLHSRDMADNNYFSHTSLDGRTMSQRMSNQGIKWSSCAENIAAGNPSGINTYNQWVNSSGHRKNMLGKYNYLGVGSAYNSASPYRYYYTQNFYR